MKASLFASALAVAIPSAVAATGQSTQSHTPAPACPPRAASPQEQGKIFEAFTKGFYVDYKITDAFTNYVWVDYIQHNPTVGQGRDAAIAKLAPSASSRNTTVVHSGLVGDIGFVHHYEFGSSPLIKIIDIYRLNGSCIVEHWDAIATLTTEEINPKPLA
ncbi:hypothetical protein PT974_05421 [Cladobotryum mycophilum]|uniref:SnoaL-like domain-containing protein n=1 Tax=Cladobotryum mycophilum TaxID=491253 RepID=A0ABR0SJT1_9HYPO